MDAPARSEDSQGESYEEEAEDTSQEVADDQLVHAAVPSLESLSHLRDITDAAVCWQVSSAKPGNGVEQLRDCSTDTYWQSDGTGQ